MSETKTPSIIEMLESGEACGLTTLSEACTNYLNHPYMFFDVSQYSEQVEDLTDELIGYGLANFEGSYLVRIRKMTVEEAITIVKNAQDKE